MAQINPRRNRGAFKIYILNPIPPSTFNEKESTHDQRRCQCEPPKSSGQYHGQYDHDTQDDGQTAQGVPSPSASFSHKKPPSHFCMDTPGINT
jgi:hypothetical protein